MIPAGSASSPATGRPTALLVFGHDDRNLLPAIVPIAARESEECPTARHARGCQGDRFPAVQALQSGRTFASRRERSDRRTRLPPDRGERGRTVARTIWPRPSAAARVYFHRLFKAIDRTDAEGLCRRASRGKRAPRSARQQQRDRGDLRRGLQFEWPLLRESHRMLGMTPTHYRAGGANEEIRFAVGQSRWARSWSRRARRALRRFFWATIPTCWCAIFRTASPRPA